MTEERLSSSAGEAGADSAPPTPGLPSRIDVKRAFDVYVDGRSRTLAPSQKDAAIESRSPAPRLDGRGESVQDERSAPSTRVTVPRTLSFDRGAGTWRNQLPGQDRGEP